MNGNRNFERLLESFIREHKDDFTNGVDTEYIKDIDIDGMSYNTICHRIKKYCTKKRVRRNGKKIMMYYLKPQYVNPERYCNYCTFRTYEEFHEEAFHEEQNETSKYVDISTQTGPITEALTVGEVHTLLDPIIIKLKNLSRFL